MKFNSYFRLIGKILFKKDVMPEYVTFFITKCCNSKCKHCFYWRELNKKEKELNLEEMDKISKSLGKFTYLAITGGEPFLRKDISEIVSIFHRNNNIDKIAISTNGSLTKKILNDVEQILKNNKSLNLILNISLDGPKNIHDNIRGSTGSFDKAIKTYGELVKLKEGYNNLSVGIRMTYSSLNQNYIFDIYYYIRDMLKPDSVNAALVRGDAKDPKSKNINLDGYEKLCKEIEEDYIKKKIKGYKFSKLTSAMNIVVRNLVLKTARQKCYQSRCYGGLINATIYSEGNVFPCEMLNKSFGNLRDYNYNFRKLWRSNKAKEINTFIKKNRCFCTHECNLSTNVLFNLNYSLKLIYELLRLR